MTAVDILVLGGGPGGYVAAIRAARLGRTVAVVEGRWWGGVCLNVGCIPTKALLRNAEVADLVSRRGAEFGLTGDVHADYTLGWQRSRKVADAMSRGVAMLLKNNQITAVEGWGTFTGPHTMQVRGSDGVVSEWQFEQAIIATGTKPVGLPGVDIGGRVMTYEQLIMAQQAPKTLVIAGSGAIGVEFASLMASFGTQVMIVEAMDRLLPGEDEAIGTELARSLRRRGISYRLGTPVLGVEQGNDSVSVRAGGETLVADALLLALGFSPVVDGFGLESLGVVKDPKGYIAVDAAMRTNVPGIFAIGDVTGKLMLAHVASAQGVVAAEAACGLAPAPLDYALMPRAYYCEPQVAAFGMTEAQAKDAGREVAVSRFPFSANGKAQGLGERAGFVMMVADAATHQLLGAHMVGPGVTELLGELTLAARCGLTTEQIAHNVHAHPTLSEAVKGAAEGIGGRPIDL